MCIFIRCQCTHGELAQMSDTGDEWQVARRRKGAARRSKSLQVSAASTCCPEQLDVGKTVKRLRDTV